MAMSATAAAKRRRAGGVLSSPMLQPPHILQSIPPNKLISTLQNIQQGSFEPIQPFNNSQESQQQPVTNMQNTKSTNNIPNFSNMDPTKGLTLQQVITLLNTRLINLEKNVKQDCHTGIQQIVSETTDPLSINIDFQSKMEESLSQSEVRIQESLYSIIEDAVSKKIDDIRSNMIQTTEEIVMQQMGEFNHRYELLATEILNVKNMILELQSYTMGVNKMLLEERMNVFSELTSNQFKTTEDEVKLDADIVSLNFDTEEEVTSNSDTDHLVNDNINNEITTQHEPDVEANNDVEELDAPIYHHSNNVNMELSMNAMEEKTPENLEEILKNEPEASKIEETENSDFILVSSKSKKGKGGKNQKKKNTVNVEQEISLST